MRQAYADSSALVAIAFREAGGARVARALDAFEHVYASDLLDAEVRSALVREGVAWDARFLESISWVLPERPLSAELERVFSKGYVRGADAWHLACALYLSPEPGELVFVTLDEPQAKVAAALGFAR